MIEKDTLPDEEQIKDIPPEVLLNRFKRLIFKVSNRYAKEAARLNWIDLEDLQQIATVSLLNAQKSYEQTESSPPFIIYAMIIMCRDITRALKIRQTQEGYEREPSMISLDKPVSEDEETTIGDLIASEEETAEEIIERKEIVFRVRSAVDTLPENLEEIINKIYLYDPTETRSQIAKEKGVGINTVRESERKAFEKLRRELSDLRDYRPPHIGLKNFRTIWTSEPELYAITIENRLQNLKEMYRKQVSQNEEES